MDLSFKVIFDILALIGVGCGVAIAIPGISDMFGEGQQSSAGAKKIFSGVATALSSFLLFGWIGIKVNEASDLAQKICVSLSSFRPPML